MKYCTFNDNFLQLEPSSFCKARYNDFKIVAVWLLDFIHSIFKDKQSIIASVVCFGYKNKYISKYIKKKW